MDHGFSWIACWDLCNRKLHNFLYVCLYCLCTVFKSRFYYFLLFYLLYAFGTSGPIQEPWPYIKASYRLVVANPFILVAIHIYFLRFILFRHSSLDCTNYYIRLVIWCTISRSIYYVAHFHFSFGTWMKVEKLADQFSYAEGLLERQSPFSVSQVSMHLFLFFFFFFFILYSLFAIFWVGDCFFASNTSI